MGNSRGYKEIPSRLIIRPTPTSPPPPLPFLPLFSIKKKSRQSVRQSFRPRRFPSSPLRPLPPTRRRLLLPSRQQHRPPRLRSRHCLCPTGHRRSPLPLAATEPEDAQ